MIRRRPRRQNTPAPGMTSGTLQLEVWGRELSSGRDVQKKPYRTPLQFKGRGTPTMARPAPTLMFLADQFVQAGGRVPRPGSGVPHSARMATRGVAPLAGHPTLAWKTGRSSIARNPSRTALSGRLGSKPRCRRLDASTYWWPISGVRMKSSCWSRISSARPVARLLA